MTAPTEDALNGAAPGPEDEDAGENAYIKRVAEIRAPLIAYRKEKGITHPDLAKLMNANRSRAIGVETCDPNQLRLHSLLRYAEALGLEVTLEFKPKQ